MENSQQFQALGGGPPSEPTLQAGDLLFPRPRDGWVPYFTGSSTGDQRQSYADEAQHWQTIREEVTKGRGVMALEARKKISAMSYEEFRARYGGVAELHATGMHFYTGHVALYVGGDVVEALWGTTKLVIHRPYAKWAKEHAAALVWQSRIIGADETTLRRICDIAVAQVGKPYDFLDLNLEDASGFYCSKLIWFATMEAMGLPLDDDPNPDRWFWYSPKQLLHSRHLDPIQVPEEY